MITYEASYDRKLRFAADDWRSDRSHRVASASGDTDPQSNAYGLTVLQLSIT